MPRQPRSSPGPAGSSSQDPPRTGRVDGPGHAEGSCVRMFLKILSEDNRQLQKMLLLTPAAP